MMTDFKRLEALKAVDDLAKAVYINWIHELDGICTATLTAEKLRGAFNAMKKSMDAINTLDHYIINSDDGGEEK